MTSSIRSATGTGRSWSKDNQKLISGVELTAEVLLRKEAQTSRPLDRTLSESMATGNVRRLAGGRSNSTLSNDFDGLFFGDDALYFGDAFTYDINTGESASSAIDSISVANPTNDDTNTIVGSTTVASTVSADESNTLMVEDVPFEMVSASNIAVPINEEAIAAKVVTFDTDRTSFTCSAGDLATHGDEYNSDSTRIEQVIEFDYDLMLPPGSDLDIALVNFESAVLSFVGARLESTSCVLGERRLQSSADQSIALEKMSSLPGDTLNKRAICSENTVLSETLLDCYPITGYVSAYYSSDVTKSNQVAQSIRDMIEDGMSSNVIITDSDMQANFIGFRSILEEVDMLLTSQTQVESNSNAATIGMFCAGLVVVVAIGLSVFAMKRRYSNKKNDVNTTDTLPSNVENAIKPVDTYDEDNTDHQSNFYGHSISSASTEVVSNRHKPVVNPLLLEERIVEEELSDDEDQDALPSFNHVWCQEDGCV